jgi:hypothetical protein
MEVKSNPATIVVANCTAIYIINHISCVYYFFSIWLYSLRIVATIYHTCGWYAKHRTKEAIQNLEAKYI